MIAHHFPHTYARLRAEELRREAERERTARALVRAARAQAAGRGDPVAGSPAGSSRPHFRHRFTRAA